MEKGQLITVSEWMEHGNIMEYIKNNHANRLELVRALLPSPLPSLKRNNSCTAQLKV